MHVNNFNRVICAAAKVLVDKAQSTNSAYMQEEIKAGCKGAAKYCKKIGLCLVDKRKNNQGREKYEQTLKGGKVSHAVYIQN